MGLRIYIDDFAMSWRGSNFKDVPCFLRALRALIQDVIEDTLFLPTNKTKNKSVSSSLALEDIVRPDLKSMGVQLVETAPLSGD